MRGLKLISYNLFITVGYRRLPPPNRQQITTSRGRYLNPARSCRATATTALVPIQPAFSDAERLALAGFLAGYRGLTREAYALDLRQFTTWCRSAP